MRELAASAPITGYVRVTWVRDCFAEIDCLRTDLKTAELNATEDGLEIDRLRAELKALQEAVNALTVKANLWDNRYEDED